jgi:DNA repair exonuclease SbcCD ATPase subunit
MIDEYLDKLEDLERIRQIKIQELEKWKIKKDKAVQFSNDLEIARNIIQTAAQITQTQLSDQLSKIVSMALQTIFEDPYEFKVDFVKRRNKTECDLLLTKNGQDFTPLDSCGYGIADIVSFALRIAYWKLEGKYRNTFFLDEPLRNLSRDRLPNASIMIKQLSKELKIQFIILTHNKTLIEAADRVFRTDYGRIRRVK